MEGDDTGDEDEVCSPDRGPDGHPADEDAISLTWSETSLDLAGPALSQAIEHLYSLYRRELQDRAADEGQAWTTRSLNRLLSYMLR